jgi:hypothetical protein
MHAGGVGTDEGGAALHATPPAPSARHHAPAVAALMGATQRQPELLPAAAPAGARVVYCSSSPAAQDGGVRAARTASICACRLAKLRGGDGGGGLGGSGGGGGAGQSGRGPSDGQGVGVAPVANAGTEPHRPLPSKFKA